MDKKLDEAAVWKRVNAAAERAQKIPEQTWDMPSLPFGLLNAMQEGVALYQGFHGLYRRTGKQVWFRLAQQQKNENRTLKRLYLLQTGIAPEVQKKAENHSSLRGLITMQETQVQTLCTLEQQAVGPGKRTLGRLAEDAQSRWERLLEML